MIRELDVTPEIKYLHRSSQVMFKFISLLRFPDNTRLENYALHRLIKVIFRIYLVFVFFLPALLDTKSYFSCKQSVTKYTPYSELENTLVEKCTESALHFIIQSYGYLFTEIFSHSLYKSSILFCVVIGIFLLAVFVAAQIFILTYRVLLYILIGDWQK